MSLLNDCSMMSRRGVSPSPRRWMIPWLVLSLALTASPATAQTQPPGSGAQLERIGNPAANYVSGAVNAFADAWAMNCDRYVYDDDYKEASRSDKLTLPDVSAVVSAIATVQPSHASGAASGSVTATMEVPVGTVGEVAGADVGGLLDTTGSAASGGDCGWAYNTTCVGGINDKWVGASAGGDWRVVCEPGRTEATLHSEIQIGILATQMPDGAEVEATAGRLYVYAHYDGYHQRWEVLQSTTGPGSTGTYSYQNGPSLGVSHSGTYSVGCGAFVRADTRFSGMAVQGQQNGHDYIQITATATSTID